MAVTLTGGSGLFDRLGKLAYLFSIVDSFMSQSGSGKLQDEVNDAIEVFDGSTSNLLRGVIAGMPEAALQFEVTAELFYADIRTAAQETVIEMVDADSRLSERTLDRALEVLVDQMVAASATVDANEPSTSTTAGGSNVGTATVFVTLTGPDAVARQQVYAEDIRLVVTSDATARGEVIAVNGRDGRADSTLSPRWPDGSRASATITVFDPSVDGLLSNNSFEDWTGGTPDDWTATGTLLSEETTTVHLGTSALKITGNGSGTQILHQDLSEAGLSSNTHYLCAFSYRLAANPAAGSLKVELWDGTSTIDSVTVNLTSATTGSWQQVVRAFRIPSPVPPTVLFRINVTGPLSNASVLLIDDVMFGVEPAELYPGGPIMAVVATNDTLATGDEWTVAVANDYRGAFQTFCWRMFELPERQLPSATGGSETINDSLIA